MYRKELDTIALPVEGKTTAINSGVGIQLQGVAESARRCLERAADKRFLDGCCAGAARLRRGPEPGGQIPFVRGAWIKQCLERAGHEVPIKLDDKGRQRVAEDLLSGLVHPGGCAPDCRKGRRQCGRQPRIDGLHIGPPSKVKSLSALVASQT